PRRLSGPPRRARPGSAIGDTSEDTCASAAREMKIAAPLASVRAELRRKAALGGLGSGRRLLLLELDQQPARTADHIEFFEQFLLDLGWQRQGKAEDIAQGGQRQASLQQLLRLLHGSAVAM